MYFKSNFKVEEEFDSEHDTNSESSSNSQSEEGEGSEDEERSLGSVDSEEENFAKKSKKDYSFSNQKLHVEDDEDLEEFSYENMDQETKFDLRNDEEDELE